MTATGCSSVATPDVPSERGDAGPYDLSGYLLKGPVSGSTVTAYKLQGALTAGAILATTATDETGFFGFALPPYNGDVLLVASGGTYLEEALPADTDGNPRRLALDRDFLGVALGVRTGQPATANVTPISHLAVHLARFHAGRGEDGHKALVDALAHLGAHFGNGSGVSPPLDWQTFVPAADTGAQLTPADRAALVLAGLSQLALDMSGEAGLSPGGKVNALSLVIALAEDLEADGVFDGRGAAGRLALPSDPGIPSAHPVPLDGTTVRLRLAAAIASFVSSSRNASGITVPDVGGMLAALSGSSDQFLFRTEGTTFDVTPPVLTLVTAPPPFTNQPTVTFTVTADDGASSSGVRSVLARNGDGTVVPALPTDAGVWTFSAAPVGTRPGLDVWAVDQAGNSGEQLPLGEHHVRVPCLLDTAPPVVLQDFSVPSYRDERWMTLATPTVPPVFAWPSAPPLSAIGPGPERAIWKTSVRLWPGPSPSGSDLETTNGANTPFLQVGIPFNAAIDAPISSVRYRISIDGVPDATGPLVPAGRTGSGVLYFDLPLTTETLPAMKAAQASPVRFTVTIAATDGAGNMTTVPLASPDPAIGGTFLFHVLGPPLFLEEDTAYASSGDPRSIFPFSLAAGTYASKFSGDNGGESARVARFRVWNPYPEAVPLTTTLTAFETVGSEQWNDLVWAMGTRTWDALGAACDGAEPSPCAYQPGGRQPYQATIDGTFACEAPVPPSSHVNPTADVFRTTDGSLTAWTSGIERPAEGYGSRVLVPAAMNGSAGSLVLYAGRPFGSFGRAPDTFATLGNPDGVSRYLRYLQDAYVSGKVLSRGRCDCDITFKPPLCLDSEVHAFEQRRWTLALTTATERFSGTISGTTFARSGPTTDLGDGSPKVLLFFGEARY